MRTPPPSPGNPSPKRSPILGLPLDDDPVPRPPGLSHDPEPADIQPESALRLTVIVPARDEARTLAACLRSLTAQSDDFFRLGRDWELLIVDDASTDATRSIADDVARHHDGVHVLAAPALDMRAAQRTFTGKTNACWHAAGQAQGRWLLFTDADTLHQPGALLRALHEAEKHGVALLSYSPRQIVHGLAQRTLMPLVFSELALVYPPAEVNDPARRLAAANGQFLLVDRAVYRSVGGHQAVGRTVLEDVALAELIKRAAGRHGDRPGHPARGIRLRYAPEAVSTRMYAGLGDMLAGWRKNLALLFPHALALAGWRLLDLALFLLPLLLIPLHYLVVWQQAALLAIWARTLLRFYRRVARSNFPALDVALAPLGLTLFVYLLVASWMDHRLFHHVVWKGREYKQQ